MKVKIADVGISRLISLLLPGAFRFVALKFGEKRPEEASLSQQHMHGKLT